MLLNLRSILTDCEGAKPEVLTTLKDNMEITSRLMEQTRSVSLDLHPKILKDLGFIPALRWLLQRTAKLTKAQIHFEPPQNYRPLTSESELEIFRVAQEALTNITRHANAKNIWVQLVQNHGQSDLIISDDGCGFNQAFHSREQLPTNGFGLHSMFARAEMIGADLHICSTPGQGTTVTITYEHQNHHHPGR